MGPCLAKSKSKKLSGEDDEALHNKEKVSFIVNPTLTLLRNPGPKTGRANSTAVSHADSDHEHSVEARRSISAAHDSTREEYTIPKELYVTKSVVKFRFGGDGDVPADCFEHACKRPALTEEEEYIILSSWDEIQEEMMSMGTCAFLTLFKDHPQFMYYFSRFQGVSAGSLSTSLALGEHVGRLMLLISRIIERTHYHLDIEATLHTLGDLHRKKGIKRPVLLLFIPYFMQAMDEANFKSWNKEKYDAWEKFMYLIAHVMCERLHGGTKDGPEKLTKSSNSA